MDDDGIEIEQLPDDRVVLDRACTAFAGVRAHA
jgi:hypothetical protein